jgi:hypothetical protein
MKERNGEDAMSVRDAYDGGMERALSGIYESAVRGRQLFREAYRLVRDENRRLREALKAVRVKAIPAGAAVALRREDWETP